MEVLHSSGSPDICIGEFYTENGNIKPCNLFDEIILVTGISFYEILKVKESTPLFAEDHMERLLNSAKNKGAGILPALSLLTENMELLVSQNMSIKEGNIRVLIHYPDSLDNNPVIYGNYIPHYYPSEMEYTEGVPVILEKAERLNVHSKIINLGFRTEIQKRIRAENAYEALFVNKEGYITEGSKSNFFIIRKNKIVTPPEKDVLQGITRKYILELCRNSGIDSEESRIHQSEIATFESCFISGTSPGVLAVRNIGGTFFSPGHPLLQELARRYDSLVSYYITANRSEHKNN